MNTRFSDYSLIVEGILLGHYYPVSSRMKKRTLSIDRFRKVDLGEEWEDTNIDDCLEHLGDSGGGDHDRVGLREFVVMLAVGRVCRPQKRVSFLLYVCLLCL